MDAGGMLCVHRWRLSFCVPCYKHVVCFVNEMAIFINETFRLLSRDVFQRVLSTADMPVHFSHYRREEKLFIKQNTLFFQAHMSTPFIICIRAAFIVRMEDSFSPEYHHSNKLTSHSPS